MTDSVSENHYSIRFVYGPDNQRVKSVLRDSGNVIKTKYYSPGYEKEITPTGTRELTYINSPYGLIAIVIKKGDSDSTFYTETDHLGSIIGLLRETGSYKEQYSFDAWGRRRNPKDWSYDSIPAPTVIDRGFTGHEHLDLFGLINMNGRMYDPVVGRFLGVDPVIQFGDNSESFNGYSYCLNNPLRYSDPTGFSVASNSGPTVEVQYIHDLIYGPQSRVDLLLRELFGLMYDDVYHGGHDYVILVSGMSPFGGGGGGSGNNGGISSKPDGTSESANSPHGPRVDDPESKMSIDIDGAVKYLDNHVYKPYGVGKCATNVVDAWVNGGHATIQDYPQPAKAFGQVFLKWGFKTVNVSTLDEYKPQKGDVAILQKWRNNSDGHIEVYDGDQWVSDYKQGQDFYPWKDSRGAKDLPSFIIYRLHN